MQLYFLDKNKNCLLFVLHFILFCISIYPILSVNVLPFVDYPNHLARAFIIYNHGNNPDIDAMYDVKWRIAPYIMMEFLIPFFQNFMDIYSAGKLFIVTALLFIVVGVVAISASIHKKPSYLTLLLYPFLYNMDLAFGFLNFIFGLGVALISFAIWVKFRKNLSQLRIVLLFIIMTLNYFTHLITYGLLGLSIVLYEGFFYNLRDVTERNIYIKKMFLLGGLAVPQALLFLLAPHAVSELGTHFGDFVDHLMTLLSPTLFYNNGIDFLILFLVVVFLFSNSIKRDNSFTKLLITLAIVSLFLPTDLFGIFLFNIRLPIFIIFLLIAFSSLNNEKFRSLKIFSFVFVLIISATSIFRYSEIEKNITICGNMIEEFRGKLNNVLTIPAVPVLTVIDREGNSCPYRNAFDHINSLAIIESFDFVPEVFTIIPPILYKDKFKNIKPDLYGQNDSSRAEVFFAEKNNDNYWQTEGKKFKYVIFIDQGKKIYEIPTFWDIKSKGSFFSIYENKLFQN